MSTGQQFGRAANLVLASTASPFPGGLDLSQMRFNFSIKSADVETPNLAYIRVYNLSDNTADQAISEYDSVILQAGYSSNIGVIFRGTIKQFRRGKERNVDSFLDIFAADGDLAYNFGLINGGQGITIGQYPNGPSPAQQLNAVASSMGIPLDPNAAQNVTGGILPRGKTLFGLARFYARDLADSSSARWSIQDGSLVVIPLNGFLPGDIIKVNSATGMIGVPEATDNGITIRMLLNPLVKIGQRIQLNNKDVTQTIVKQQFFPSYSSAPTMVASTANDGIYRVLVVEHVGDTRGQEWYTDVVCLSLDQSSGSGQVQPFG